MRDEVVMMGLRRPGKALLAVMGVLLAIWVMFAVGINYGGLDRSAFLFRERRPQQAVTYPGGGRALVQFRVDCIALGFGRLAAQWTGHFAYWRQNSDISLLSL